MEQRLAFTMVFLTGAVSIGGCGSFGEACTEMACGSGVTTTIGNGHDIFDSPLPLAASVCIDDTHCSDLTINLPDFAPPTCEPAQMGPFASCWIEADGTVVVEQFQDNLANGSHQVHVTIRDAQNMVVVDETRPVSITVSHPNGESCEPTCYTGAVTL